MHDFNYRKNTLYCEDLEVARFAKKVPTPFYLYSQKTIADHYLKIKDAFSALSPLICYSVKANSNLAILNILIKLGAGLDIVSGGELYRAKRVNCPAKKIVYASVGKTAQEIKRALVEGILLFNIESYAELVQLNKIAEKEKKRPLVALRVNPDINPKTHKYITTGKKGTKFGIGLEEAQGIFLRKDNFPFLRLEGIHIHIGSQITDYLPYVRALKKIKELIRRLRKKKIKISYLDIGGGFGIVYNQENPRTAQELAEKIIPLIKGLGVKLILEPGRFIVGNSGILVTKVLYIKEAAEKRFIIVDAAMNDLLRPSLYGAYHKISPLIVSKDSKADSLVPADIVGPVCESGDFLGKNRRISVREGEYLAVMSAGAYGFSMASNYNSRPRCAEYLVKGKQAYLIRKKETYADLVGKEFIKPKLIK